jgi:hypothetical protein
VTRECALQLVSADFLRLEVVLGGFSQKTRVVLRGFYGSRIKHRAGIERAFLVHSLGRRAGALAHTPSDAPVSPSAEIDLALCHLGGLGGPRSYRESFP